MIRRTSLDFACPRCHSPAGQLCRDLFGSISTPLLPRFQHRDRVRLACQANDAALGDKAPPRSTPHLRQLAAAFDSLLALGVRITIISPPVGASVALGGVQPLQPTQRSEVQ